MLNAFIVPLIAVFFLSLTVPQVGLCLNLYDDFSSSAINATKWQNYEQVREIQSGQLRMKLRSSTNTTGPIEQGLWLQDPTSINAIEATVTPTSYQNSQGARANIFVGGRFFNDGTGAPGAYTGDILGQVVIGGGAISPAAVWVVVRFTDPNDTNQYVIINSGNFTLAPVLGTSYNIFVGWNEAAKQFTFRISDGSCYRGEGLYNCLDGYSRQYACKISLREDIE